MPERMPERMPHVACGALQRTLARLRAIDRRDEQPANHYQQRDQGRHRAERVNDGGGHRCRQALQFERQRVLIADCLRGAGDFVPGQRKAEHRDADDGGPDDGKHDILERLPRRGPEIARGFFECGIEAVEHGEHHEQAERQGPGEMRAERGRVETHRRRPAVRERLEAPRVRQILDERVEQTERQPDAERHDDRRHDQTRDRHVKNRRVAAKAAPECEARAHREQDRQHGDGKSEFD